MNSKISLKLNIVMNYILTISSFIFPLITFPYVSRVLGATRIGTVNFAISYVSYFTMFGMIGLTSYGVRATAKVRDNQKKLEKVVQELMILNSISMGIMIVLYILSIFLIDKVSQEKPLYFMMTLSLIFSVLGTEWLYKGLERYSYITIRSIVFKFISILMMFAFVHSSDDYVMYGFVTILASVGSNLMNFINLRKIISFRPVADLDIWQHLKPNMTFFFIAASWTLFTSIDTIFLGFMTNDTEVGYLSAAIRIKQLLASLLTSISIALLPRLSHHHAKGEHDSFNRLVAKTLNVTLIIAIPIPIYFILFAKEVILFISGAGFENAVLPLQFILPSVLFMGLSSLITNQILVPTNKENLVLKATLLTCLVNVIMNFLLIPSFMSTGAAFSSTVAEGLVAGLQIYYIRQDAKMWFQSSVLFKSLLSGFLAVLVVFLVNLILPTDQPFLILAVTGSLFAISYVLLLVLFREETVRDILQSLLEKVKKNG